jgi:hypothetical protein
MNIEFKKLYLLKTKKQQIDNILQTDNTSNETKTQNNNIVIQEINETIKIDALFINLIDKALFPKWYIEITLKINSEFQLTIILLLDSGADMNIIQICSTIDEQRYQYAKGYFGYLNKLMLSQNK